MTHPLFEHWESLRRRLDQAARRAGRAPEAVEVVAVVKHAALDDVRALRASGKARWLGESRVQEAVRRRAGLAGPSAGWRFIGHLQTNKAKAALELFEYIDSLDSLDLAEALQRRLEGTGRELGVLVQVKLTERETQSGVSLDETHAFVERLKALPNLKACGLMGIAPQGEDARAAFRRLKGTYDSIFPGPAGPAGPWLSMGMSEDCEAAVEEGSTLVRVGTALFEPQQIYRDRLDRTDKGGSE